MKLRSPITASFARRPESVYFCQPGIHRSPHHSSVDTIYFDNFILADKLDEIKIEKK